MGEDSGIKQYSTANMDEMAARAPTVDTKAVMQAYYAVRIAGRDPLEHKVKVLDRPFERVCGMTEVTMNAMIAQDKKKCYLTWKCPASMKKITYKVVVALEVEPSADAFTDTKCCIGKVTKFLGVECPCVAGKDGMCWHGAAAIYVLEALPRPAGMGDGVACTSEMCRWSGNPRGRKLETALPLCSMSFMQHTRGKTKRRTLCHLESSHRRFYQVYSNENLNLFRKERDELSLEAVDDATRELFDAAKEANGGRHCALAAVFDPSAVIEYEAHVNRDTSDKVKVPSRVRVIKKQKR